MIWKPNLMDPIKVSQESTSPLKERKFGQSSGQVIILNFVLSWRRIGSMSLEIFNLKNQF
jgi:hypothetical protein